jgi:hypothetical protein
MCRSEFSGSADEFGSLKGHQLLQAAAGTLYTEVATEQIFVFPYFHFPSHILSTLLIPVRPPLGNYSSR